MTIKCVLGSILYMIQPKSLIKLSKKHIAVDLDATLAMYTGFKGVDVIGDPIKPMIARVKKELEKGTEVSILTARAHGWKGKKQQQRAIKAVEEWTKKHIGKKLFVTAEKHPAFSEIWDDRAKQVVANKGVFK